MSASPPLDGSSASTAVPSQLEPAPRARRLGRFLAGRIPELVLIVFGIVLRVSLTWSFDATLGYDFPAHIQYARFLADHGRLPPYDLNFSTYNPALFYALAAVMLNAGLTVQAIARVSIASSCLQLLVAWAGLEIYLRESRFARVLAIAIAAVLPGALHIAGFFSNHAINDLFCTAAIVLLPQVLSRRGRSAVSFGVAAGACLGLALLTKISGATVVQGFLLTVAIVVLRGRSRLDVARALVPGTAAVLGLIAVIAGWHYVRHKILYGKFVVIAYDAFTLIDPIFKIPYLDRRTFGFVGYWDDAIYASPYWPSGSRPYARFGPMLVVTTFSDYYNFAFVPRPKPGKPALQLNGKPLRRSAMLPSQLSVIGGTALALLAVVAWLVSARTLWWREDYGRLLLLMMALMAMVGQLHFAIRFPNDNSGPIKGTYLQFVGPVYCALAGLAIARLWKLRAVLPRLLALGGMAAIVMVGIYSVFAKIVVPLGS